MTKETTQALHDQGVNANSLRPIVTDLVKELSVPNTKVYHLAVYGVIIIAIALVIGSIAIILKQEGSSNIPEFFAVALGTALGAIAGMLVPTDV